MVVFLKPHKNLTKKFVEMKLTYAFLSLLFLFSLGMTAQENEGTAPYYVGEITKTHVTSINSRMGEIPQWVDSNKEAQDGRSTRAKVVPGKDPQTQDDYFSRNKSDMSQKLAGKAPILVFDAATSNSQPTDPAIAVGPDHVFVVFNTGFIIYDKDGVALSGQMPPNPSIFPSGGCCDLTVSFDQAAERWVVSFLGGGAQVAISDGTSTDPLATGWNVYNIPQINDYQKLSAWSDGYYLTDNTSGANKVWAMDRAAMIAGDAGASIQGFNLPGISTSGFYSPQVLNVTDDNLPAAGGVPIVYLQDDAWAGVTTDHVKLWTLDVDFATPANSTMSTPVELPATPFISVFDGGSFSNLTQPGGGTPIDALQATIMNQAQFRKFGGHNSGIFNFVVDTDATGGERAAVRWFEIRQSADGQPWTVFQEGTYEAPGDKHAWHASMMMDSQGNIGMGYSGMTIDPNDPNPIQVSSYYTGRFAADPLNTMTIAEELIAQGGNNIPGLRYGDYSKIDIDPNNDKTFWFINEYMSPTNGRADVVGVFQIAPNFADDTGAVALDAPETGTLTATEDVTITVFNFGENAASGFDVSYTIDGGTTVTETFAGTVNSSESATYTFATQADLSTVGQTYSFEICTNLSGDEDNGNDCVTVEVTHLQPNDIGVTEITAPVSGVGLGAAEVITVTINNFGGAEQSNFDVSYDLDGTVVTETVAGPLPGNTSVSYDFTATGDFSALGTYDLSATTSLTGDSDTSNDEIAVTITNANCQPTGDCSFGDGFQLFSVTDINNPSACEGYADFTNLVAVMEPDTTYDLTVTTGYGDQFVTVWIDFNDDFDLTADEIVVDNFEIADGQAGGSYTETFDLVIPAGVALGPHLMRAKTNWNGPVPTDACEETQYGETEDYTANIGALGINDILGENALTIVDEGNNNFDITLTSSLYTEKLELTVHNILGQQIFNSRLENNNGAYNYDLDLSYVAKGIYLVRVGNDQAGQTKKLIVR